MVLTTSAFWGQGPMGSTAACRHAAASSGGDGSDDEVAISPIDGLGAPTTAAVVECGCAPVRSYEDLVLHLAARGAGTVTELDFGGRHTAIWKSTKAK